MFDILSHYFCNFKKTKNFKNFLFCLSKETNMSQRVIALRNNLYYVHMSYNFHKIKADAIYQLQLNGTLIGIEETPVFDKLAQEMNLYSFSLAKIKPAPFLSRYSKSVLREIDLK